MALKAAGAALLMLAALAGCARIGTLLPKAASQLAPGGSISRADIEKSGEPVMRLRVPSRGIETFLTIRDTQGNVVNWSSADGMLFSFRDGVLIGTRGLGADLMSSEAPGARQISSGGGFERAYFFTDADEQTGQREYRCVVSVDGRETVAIYGRNHETRKLSEICQGDQGRITNHYWMENNRIRKSREWVSPAVGLIELERIVD